MSFGCDRGLPLPGVCCIVGGRCCQSDCVRGSDGVVARGAEVHLELGPLLRPAGLPHRAHLTGIGEMLCAWVTESEYGHSAL